MSENSKMNYDEELKKLYDLAKEKNELWLALEILRESQRENKND